MTAAANWQPQPGVAYQQTNNFYTHYYSLSESELTREADSHDEPAAVGNPIKEAVQHGADRAGIYLSGRGWPKPAVCRDSDFWITDMSGDDGLDIETKTSQSYGQTGKTITNQSVGERSITVTGAILRTWTSTRRC